MTMLESTFYNSSPFILFLVENSNNSYIVFIRSKMISEQFAAHYRKFALGIPWNSEEGTFVGMVSCRIYVGKVEIMTPLTFVKA